MINRTYTVDELLENPSFQRWARGSAGIAEKERWDAWVEASEEHRNIAHAALLTLAGFSFGTASSPDARQAWQRLDERLGQEHRAINKKVHRDKTNRILELRWIYRVAAGILIILTTGLIFYLGYPTLRNQKQQTIRQIEQKVNTNFGERKHIKLTDGSSITLNANSELVYRKDPVHPTNIAIRLRGEAFFSVAHRENSNEYPFRVQTADGTVRVLGTEFAVSTRDRKTRVILEKGKVEINLNRRIDGKADRTVLEPNQLAEFGSLNDTLVIRNVNTEVYTSWRTDKLVFDRTPLSEVLKRIKYTFGVEVKVRNPGLYDRSVSGTIKNAEMNVVLSTLSKVISAPIEVQGTTVYVGGS